MSLDLLSLCVVGKREQQRQKRPFRRGDGAHGVALRHCCGCRGDEAHGVALCHCCGCGWRVTRRAGSAASCVRVEGDVAHGVDCVVRAGGG